MNRKNERFSLKRTRYPWSILLIFSVCTLTLGWVNSAQSFNFDNFDSGIQATPSSTQLAAGWGGRDQTPNTQPNTPANVPTNIPANTPTPSPTNASVSCGATQTENGGPGRTEKKHIVSPTQGIAKVLYNMYSVPDQLEVFYEGKLVGTTGTVVSGSKAIDIPINGSSTEATVVISAPASETAWTYAFFCPGQEVSKEAMDQIVNYNPSTEPSVADLIRGILQDVPIPRQIRNLLPF